MIGTQIFADKRRKRFPQELLGRRSAQMLAEKDSPETIGTILYDSTTIRQR